MLTRADRVAVSRSCFDVVVRESRDAAGNLGLDVIPVVQMHVVFGLWVSISCSRETVQEIGHIVARERRRFARLETAEATAKNGKFGGSNTD